MVTLALIALVTSVGMLIIFRFTSNQRGIARAKAQVVSQVMAIRLFKDDPWITVKCLGRALHANLGYLRHSLVPIAVMILPVALLLIHLDSWFTGRPFRVDEKTCVSVRFRPSSAGTLPSISLLPARDAGFLSETPPLRIPSLREINWRIRLLTEGFHSLDFEMNSRSFSKQLVVGDGVQRITSSRPGSGFPGALLYPGETPLPEDLGIEAITVDYPPRPCSLLGVSMAWWMAFFLMTLVFAFLLKKPMGVVA